MSGVKKSNMLPDSVQPNLGEVVASLRGFNRWKLREVAERCKLDISYLSLIENGLRTPSLPVAMTIAAEFGVPITWLIEKIELTVVENDSQPTNKGE